MNADGSNPRNLTASLDRSIDDVQWAPNGRDLYIRYDDHAVTKVARVALNGKVTPVVQGLAGGSLDRPYTGGDFSIANDGTIAFTSGNGARPWSLRVAFVFSALSWHSGSGQRQRLTRRRARSRSRLDSDEDGGDA